MKRDTQKAQKLLRLHVLVAMAGVTLIMVCTTMYHYHEFGEATYMIWCSLFMVFIGGPLAGVASWMRSGDWRQP